MILHCSDNKTSSDPDVEERRRLFEDIFSLLEAQGCVLHYYYSVSYCDLRCHSSSAPAGVGFFHS